MRFCFTTSKAAVIEITMRSIRNDKQLFVLGTRIRSHHGLVAIRLAVHHVMVCRFAKITAVSVRAVHDQISGDAARHAKPGNEQQSRGFMKSAECIVYLTCIYRISIVYLSCIYRISIVFMGFKAAANGLSKGCQGV